MATTIIQGRSLSLTIDGDTYNDQASVVTLVRSAERSTFEVLSGTAYKTLNYTAELQVEMYADWGAAGSLCEALWNAADTAPDTALAFSFEANGATFTGNCFPSFPDAGGADPVTAITVNVTLTVEDGDVTLA
jgi:hypothetical protein